jgi:ferrous iron transport protein A
MNSAHPHLSVRGQPAPSDPGRHPGRGEKRAGPASVAAAPEPPVDSSRGVPLSTLGAGDRARVLAVDSTTAAGRRLLDLGFVPQTEIRVIRRAPLGDPIAFYLRGYQLCLRRSEAERIRVVGVRPAGGG